MRQRNKLSAVPVFLFSFQLCRIKWSTTDRLTFLLSEHISLWKRCHLYFVYRVYRAQLVMSSVDWTFRIVNILLLFYFNPFFRGKRLIFIGPPKIQFLPTPLVLTACALQCDTSVCKTLLLLWLSGQQLLLIQLWILASKVKMGWNFISGWTIPLISDKQFVICPLFVVRHIGVCNKWFNYSTCGAALF